jgi:hypothetical protein
MALPDDSAAIAFGKSVIRDLMRGKDARYASWTMDIIEGELTVSRIPIKVRR